MLHLPHLPPLLPLPPPPPPPPIATVLQRSATDCAGEGDSPETVRLPLRIIEPELLAGTLHFSVFFVSPQWSPDQTLQGRRYLSLKRRATVSAAPRNARRLR